MAREAPVTNRLRIASLSEAVAHSRPILSSKDTNWEGLLAEVYRVEQPLRTPKHAFIDVEIGMVLAGRISTELIGCGHDSLAPGEITIRAPGVDSVSATQGGEGLSCHLALAAFDGYDFDYCGNAELAPQVKISDTKLQHLLSLLHLELQSGLSSGRLFADGLRIALVAHLLSHYSNKRLKLREYPGGMPGRRLRRTIDYILSNLGKKLSISELAEIAGMSPLLLLSLI